MVVLNYICSYDGGPPIPCRLHVIICLELIRFFHCLYVFTGSRNIIIDKASYTPGLHSLRVTFMTGGGQSTTTNLAFQGKCYACMHGC